MQDVEVILVLEDRLYSFSNPDVNHGIGNHASIAACTRCAKRVCMINIEVIVFALQNEPCLVVWQDGTCSVEFGYVQCVCLSAWRCQSNLPKRDYVRRPRVRSISSTLQYFTVSYQI